jgi:outer membrane protein TolC
VNRRYQRMAANEERIADLLFRQQLINTVYGVTRLYSDLVALGEDLKVKEDAYALAQKLLADTTAHVEEGTLAAVEMARAKAQVFSTRVDLEKARGQWEEQQAIFKNVLTRRGGADPMVRAAPLVPLTTLSADSAGGERKLEDLLAEAGANRPDLAQAGLQANNVELSLEGARNAVKPQLDLTASAQNSGLAGDLNPLLIPTDPAFLGGYGTALGQVFRRNYPTYAAGIQLELPVRNRVAQADLARDQAMLRQMEIRVQQLRNQARLEVEDALIAVGRARAAHEAARQALEFQQESWAAETAKFEIGASTSLFLVQVQNALVQARSSEVSARAALVKAQAALDRATGATLERNHISIDAARQGTM